MKTVFSEWQTYERDVVPADAGAVQREECRRAFYAGAMAGHGLTMDATTPTNVDECERRLVDLETELVGVLQDLKIERHR